MLLSGVLLTGYVTSALFGLVRSSSQHYAFFVFAVLVMTTLATMRDIHCKPIGSKKTYRQSSWFAVFMWLVCVSAVLSSFYIYWEAQRLEVEAPFFNDFDFYVGLVLTICVIVLTWIHWGLVLASLLALGIVYFFYGHLIDNPLLTHPPLDPKFVMNYIGLGTTQGFYWFAQSAVDDIYYLIIYASVLFGIGTVKSILEAGKAMGNRIAGGAAGPAIIGSGLTSMVMGVAVSNVVLTGRFTIPMMKKHGYSPAMAASIEAAASTSGQIMPPVLGLAAFIIASFLSMKYVDVVKASVYPALLYMTGVSIAVIVYAVAHKLPRLNEQVDRSALVRTLPAFVISFTVVCFLLVNYYSPSVAGLAGCVIALLISLLQGPYRPTYAELRQGFLEGFEMVAVLSLLLIAIGPLGQVFLTTNLSGRLGTFLITVLPDIKLLLLFGAAGLAIILGMGLPTPVAYLIVALALVPFLQELGVNGLVAHFFVFYFAVYSALTPPVAVAALAGAKIAGAGFWDTCVDSLKLASTTFLVPFAFAYRPELMSFPTVSASVVWVITEIVALQAILSIAMFGYCFRKLRHIERLLTAGLALWGFWALLSNDYQNTLASVASYVVLTGWFYFSRRRLFIRS
ncbi:MAG: TRAP transporter permease [Burkholderiaceae bacterium]